ncbi:MAG: hypothetical protein K8H74_12835 [Notoacmeibacter sp.]|nr:hypothetical protein [Notoacmeibacter sp.]
MGATAAPAALESKNSLLFMSAFLLQLTGSGHAKPQPSAIGGGQRIVADADTRSGALPLRIICDASK